MQPTEKNPLPAPIRHATINEGGDAAGGTGTIYSASIGDTFRGTISAGSDQDWIAVQLVGGQSYVFWVRGVDGATLGLGDTTLRVHDASGTELAFNDDALLAVNYFSAIQFTAPSTGTYYINVGSYSTGTGNYALELSTDTFSVDEVATYLTEFDWGIPTPIAFAVSPGGTLTYNIDGLTAAGQQLAEWALDAWSAALGITFQRTSATTADIMFDDNQSGAFAGPSSYNPITGEINQASVNIGTDWLTAYGTTLDSYSFVTYLHEIGHALGLGHAGPYDGIATFGTDNLYINDSTQLTIMSYFDPSSNPNVTASDVALVTPMLADLVAVHGLYGTPAAYTGNTTWGENSNVGGWLQTAFQAAFEGIGSPDISAGAAIGFTIYDTGGTDTVDFGTQTVNQVIDLRQEAISNVGGETGNMVIARGTVIENAIGGSGHDQITGNAANNSLEGNAGNDTIWGHGGNDTADGGDGRDRVYLGAGNDLFTDNAQAGPGGNDVVYLGIGNDTALGGGGADIFHGMGGADSMRGGVGNDTLYGGTGFDTIFGGGGNDEIWGGGGNDTLHGEAADDLIYGVDGNDLITGGLGNDTIWAGPGNDTVTGGPGGDRGYLGPGNDVYHDDPADTAASPRDIIYLGADNDTANGTGGRDVFHGLGGDDLLQGGDGNDEIYGGTNADILRGGGGNDTIFGGPGTDRIYLGPGDDIFLDTWQDGALGMDTITGGLGADTFQFTANSSHDVITDFEPGIDTLRLPQRTWSGTLTPQQVIDQFATVTADGVVLDFGTGMSITLEGLTTTAGLAADLELF